MARRGRGSDRGGTTIIKREEPGQEAGHHGGAWKVAYADFVTAMMAFFLIMWLLNATTEDQRKGLADYFSPNNLMSHASSGTGQPFGGHTALDSGALVSDRGAVQVFSGNRPITEPPDDPGDQPVTESVPTIPPAAADQLPPPTAPKDGPQAAKSSAPAKASSPAGAAANDQERARAEAAARDKALHRAAEEIRKSIASDPALAGLAGQVLVDVTQAGLRVQMVDAQRQAMFAFGSAEPNEAARLLMNKLVPILQKLPGALEIEGHTDAAPYPGPGRTNWDLSTERANAARRLLTEAGLPSARVQEVTGHADRDLLIKDQPLAPANRRIAIIVLRAPQAEKSD